jgi:CO/xanthine dehydrogenase Mo-binding subunit
MSRSQDDDSYSDAETERRATKALRRALTTPPKPQKEMVGKVGHLKPKRKGPEPVCRRTMPGSIPASPPRSTRAALAPTRSPPSRIISPTARGLTFARVEVDRDTGVIRIDKYVSLHDAGRILNPALLDGQVRGGFAMAIGGSVSV